MSLMKQARSLIALIFAVVGLLALPIFFELYYLRFYLVVAVVFIPFMILRFIKNEKFEERFYKRWHKARQRGYWFNVFLEGLRSLVIMNVVISLSQIFGSGRTPTDILSELPVGVLIGISIFLTVLNIIIGIAAWHENEKKYFQVLRRM